METLLTVVSIGTVTVQVYALYAMAKSYKNRQAYYAAWRKERKEYHNRELASISAAYTKLYADLETELLQMGVQISHARQHRDIDNVVTHPKRMN